MKGLNELRDEALRIATEHGFTEATVGEDVALMHSELSELLEDHRAGNEAAKVWYEMKIMAYDQMGEAVMVDGKQASVVVKLGMSAAGSLKPAGIPIEIADVLIRAFHFCGKHGIDIESAVDAKMAYNKSRPFKHGGKTI